MAKKLTAKKAKTILRDGTVRGHRLTKAQKGFFGAIAGGNSRKQPKKGRTRSYRHK